MRSAFAEIYARHRGVALPIRSAATRYRNDGVFPETVEALAARGIEGPVVRNFRPTHIADLARELGPEAVLCGMGPEHLAEAGLDLPGFLFGELIGDPRPIPDPLGMRDPAPIFQKVADGIDALAELGDRRSD